MILIPRLMTCGRLEIGGAERNIVNLANALNRSGDKVLILAIEGGKSEYRIDEGIKLKFLKYKTEGGPDILRRIALIKSTPSYSGRAAKYAEAFKPDIMLSFLTEADAAAFLVKKRLGKKIRWAVSERNDPSKADPSVKLLKKRIYSRADLLICQTRFASDYYKNIKKKIILPNISDISILPEPVEECPENGVIRLVSAGRLDAQKNYSMLLHAFAEALPELRHEARLSIYGRGPLEERLKSEAGELGISSYVEFPGFTPDWHEEIKHASVFIMSSDHEGVSNSLFEAVFMGLPVIATDVSFGDEGNTIDGNTGIIIQPGDEKALKNAVIRLVNDKETRLAMREHNRKLRQERDLNDRSASEWIDAFRELAGQKV